jgi:hypothetical protein
LFELAVLDKSDARSTDSSEHNSDQISDNSFYGSHERHFKSTGPPGTDGDERFGGSYSEMRKQGNHSGHNDGWVTRQEEKRDNRNQRRSVAITTTF